MGLDLRYPIGFLFALLGAILVGYGLLHPNLHAPLAAASLNVDAGLVMLAFGVTMTALARRASRK
jgi:hypothetical protein